MKESKHKLIMYMYNEGRCSIADIWYNLENEFDNLKQLCNYVTNLKRKGYIKVKYRKNRDRLINGRYKLRQIYWLSDFLVDKIDREKGR